MTNEKLELLKQKLNPDALTSADLGIGIDELKDLIYKKLNFIRIYLKEVRKKADLEEPLIMQDGCTIGKVCAKLHRDFITKFRYARVWGKGAKFPGQRFKKLDKKLQDKDILEIHLR